MKGSAVRIRASAPQICRSFGLRKAPAASPRGHSEDKLVTGWPDFGLGWAPLRSLGLVDQMCVRGGSHRGRVAGLTGDVNQQTPVALARDRRQATRASSIVRKTVSAAAS